MQTGQLRLSERSRLDGSELLRLIFHEPREPRADMRLGHVDVVLLRDAWRAVPHQFGQSVPVHPTFSAPRTEGVAPAVKREAF